jgi:hypothetical protein
MSTVQWAVDHINLRRAWIYMLPKSSAFLRAGFTGRLGRSCGEPSHNTRIIGKPRPTSFCTFAERTSSRPPGRHK